MTQRLRPEDLYIKPSPDDRFAAARRRLAQFCRMTARADRGDPPTTYVGQQLEAKGGF